MTEQLFTALRKLRAYQERRSDIFQSEAALQWFVRRHRRGLVDAGALVFIAGQWHARDSEFDAYLLKAGTEAARLRADAE